jgi:hypothetical protein
MIGAAFAHAISSLHWVNNLSYNARDLICLLIVNVPDGCVARMAIWRSITRGLL